MKFSGFQRYKEKRKRFILCIIQCRFAPIFLLFDYWFDIHYFSAAKIRFFYYSYNTTQKVFTRKKFSLLLFLSLNLCSSAYGHRFEGLWAHVHIFGSLSVTPPGMLMARVRQLFSSVWQGVRKSKQVVGLAIYLPAPAQLRRKGCSTAWVAGQRGKDTKKDGLVALLFFVDRWL